MKITNKLGLPQPIVDAVTNDDYEPGNADITCTQLIDAPQIRRLGIEHGDEMVEDASDRIYALVGQAIHTILERADTTALTEKRLYGKYYIQRDEHLSNKTGYTVSGKFDRLVLFPDGTLQDYKMCSVWEMIFGFKKEKENQLNVLAELCVLNGYPVKKVQIVAIFRDWQMSKAILDKQYPQTQVAVVDFPLWDLNKRVAYIESRLAVHFNGKAECTDEERWLQKRECAVVKVGNKRATKLHATPESAKAHVEMLRKDKPKDRYLIDERPPVYKRCESYCGASGFCPQWKETQEYLKNHAENGFQRPHVVPPFQK